MKKHFVIDTNIILDNPENIFKLHDGINEIYIPSTVLRELDSKKTGFSEINYNAREFARILESAEHLSTTKDEFYETKLSIKHDNNIIINIITLIDSKFESPDDEIIEVAFKLSKHLENVIFITLDSYCKIKAISKNIKTESFGSKEQQRDLQFIKELDLPEFPVEGSEINVVDPEHKNENYSYIIKSNNQTKLYQVFNNHIYELSEDIEKQDIKPMGIRQKFLVNGMLSEFTDIVVVDAPAGSGKTLLSISTAMHLIKQKRYNKIIYIRNSIESLDKGEDVGYLPGLEEKFAIYNHPLYDCIKMIARIQLEKSNKNKSIKTEISEQAVTERADELVSKFNVETMWVGELRGRTLSNAIVIVDESQNFSKKSIKTTLTRVDKTCKVLMMGSTNQIDNAYINKYNNALTTTLNACKQKWGEVRLFATNLDTVVRGPIVEFAENVFK